MSVPANLNINDLKQLSQLMSSDSGVQNIPQNQTQIQTLPKIQKKVKIQSPQTSESSDIIIPPIVKNKTTIEQPHQTVNISTNFEFMGYVVNKQTIYLLIVLIIIGIVLWYMTTEKTPEKTPEKNKNNNEENNE